MSSNRRPSIFDFEIGKNLGEGKFGMVFQVFHKATNSIYAIKKIKKDVIRKNKMIDQFLEEIKIQSYCCQGNILKLYGFFDDN
jgi:serine/threonine protein kinase